MNTVDNLKHPTLKRWSWQDIQAVYAAFGAHMREYEAVKKRCHIPDTIDISYPDSNNVFIMRFNEEVQRINAHLVALDEEIARRNQLIGVMG